MGTRVEPEKTPNEEDRYERYDPIGEYDDNVTRGIIGVMDEEDKDKEEIAD